MKLKKLFKMLSLSVVLMFYFILTLICYPFHNKKILDFIMKNCSKSIIKIIGIHVYLIRYLGDGKRSTLTPPKNKIIICNHISYLDIPILLSYFEGRFIVAKEIRKWPVIGLFVSMLGHIFVERGKKESYGKIDNAVKEGNTIIIFPEGHTSSGETIKEFKDGAFNAALKNKVCIIPVVISYDNKEAAWYGKMSLLPHLLKICDQEIEARLCIGNYVYCNEDIKFSKRVIRDIMLDEERVNHER